MSVSAKDIAKMEHSRKNARKEFYTALLEQFCRKIKVSVQLGHRDCILSVPVFLIGFPKYDLSSTVRYMCRQLQRLGYIVNLAGPLEIKVLWKKPPVHEMLPEEIEEIELPSLVNLQKMASKLRKK
jgi:hypothetical protein